MQQDVISRADERLLRYLQDPAQIETRWSSNEDAMRFSVQAYAGMVLARQRRQSWVLNQTVPPTLLAPG